MFNIIFAKPREKPCLFRKNTGGRRENARKCKEVRGGNKGKCKDMQGREVDMTRKQGDMKGKQRETERDMKEGERNENMGNEGK